jgi:hypothetical protein
MNYNKAIICWQSYGGSASTINSGRTIGHDDRRCDESRVDRQSWAEAGGDGVP